MRASADRIEARDGFLVFVALCIDDDSRSHVGGGLYRLIQSVPDQLVQLHRCNRALLNNSRANEVHLTGATLDGHIFFLSDFFHLYIRQNLY